MKAFAQSQDPGLRLHAISFGAGIASSASETAGTGTGLNFDFSTAIGGSLISVANALDQLIKF